MNLNSLLTFFSLPTTKSLKSLSGFVIPFLFLGLSTEPAMAQGFLAREDQKTHATVSAAAATLTYAGLRTLDFTKTEAFFTAGAIVLFTGVAKEITDDDVNRGDVEADGVGIAGGLLIAVSFDWVF